MSDVDYTECFNTDIQRSCSFKKLAPPLILLPPKFIQLFVHGQHAETAKSTLLQLASSHWRTDGLLWSYKSLPPHSEPNTVADLVAELMRTVLNNHPHSTNPKRCPSTPPPRPLGMLGDPEREPRGPGNYPGYQG